MGFKTKDKKLERFKLMNVEKDQENIVNRSWDNFYQERMDLLNTKR